MASTSASTEQTTQRTTEQDSSVTKHKPLIDPAHYSLKWTQLLSNIKVRHFLGDEAQEVRWVNADDPVFEVLDILTKNKISSVPVFDSGLGRFIGLVDMLDFVTYCLAKMGGKRVTMEWDKLRQSQEFSDAPVRFIMDMSGRDEWRPVDMDASLLVVMDLLSRPDMHRVPVTEDRGAKVTAIITQSRVVKWLFDNRDKLAFPEQTRTMKVRDIGSGVTSVMKDEIVSVTENQTVLEAFVVIFERMVSGVAVVNDDGKLVGSISASDLKWVAESAFDLGNRLSMTVSDFLDFRRSVPGFANDVLKKVTSSAPLTCMPDDEVEYVLTKLMTKGVHRLWIVNEEHKPVGVVALCDLINMFAHLNVNVI